MPRPSIKILHVVFSLEPGGMENGLVNVARGLNPAEFEVHACCLERGGDFVERFPNPNHVTILHKHAGFSWKTVWKLAREIHRVSPDIVHTHNLGPLIYASLATAFGTTRVILHGEHGLPEDQRVAASLRQRRRFYRFSRKVHTVSEGLRETLIQFGMPAKKIVTLLNGVDTDRFAPATSKSSAREIIQLPKEGLVLGIVGRFDPNKRHKTLVEAFTRLAEQFPTAQLVLVGDGGPERERLHQQIASSPAVARIHLVGFQSAPETFYQAMDLLVVPSTHEGLSNVVLEAMACGVPALGHVACGNAEMIRNGENGFLADIGTANKLYAELVKLLGDQTRLKQAADAVRTDVCNRFSMRKMVSRYETIYRDLTK